MISTTSGAKGAGSERFALFWSRATSVEVTAFSKLLQLRDPLFQHTVGCWWIAQILPPSFCFPAVSVSVQNVQSLEACLRFICFFFCPNFFHDFCMLKFRLMLDLRRFRLGIPMKQLTECTLCSDCGERRTRFANTSTSGIIFSWLVFRRRRRIGSKSVIRWQVVVIGNS